LPPALMDMVLRAFKKAGYPLLAQYGRMLTTTDTSPLHTGRFAELYEKNITLDPHISSDVIRYRLYNICKFANLCRDVPGDFICAGVSWGVSPKMVYDFVDLPSTGKRLHLIDRFDRSGPGRSGISSEGYNSDIEYVRRQYPPDKVVFHQQFIPQALPLPNVNKIAFAFLNTGNPEADAKSIPLLLSRLSPGGIIIIDFSANGLGVFTRHGLEPFWLPSGQGVFITLGKTPS